MQYESIADQWAGINKGELNMRTAFMLTLILTGVATIVGAMVIAAIAKTILVFRERDRLKAEVVELHKRANRVSGDYLDNLAALREENSRLRQNASADEWVNRAVLDDYERIIDNYMVEVANLKKKIATKDRLLQGADDEIARLRSRKNKGEVKA